MAHLWNVTQHHVLSPCDVYPRVALRQVGVNVFWGPRKAAIFAHCQRGHVREKSKQNECVFVREREREREMQAK